MYADEVALLDVFRFVSLRCAVAAAATGDHWLLKLRSVLLRSVAFLFELAVSADVAEELTLRAAVPVCFFDPRVSVAVVINLRSGIFSWMR